jgi:hypothetical protein
LPHVLEAVFWCLFQPPPQHSPSSRSFPYSARRRLKSAFRGPAQYWHVTHCLVVDSLVVDIFPPLLGSKESRETARRSLFLDAQRTAPIKERSEGRP